MRDFHQRPARKSGIAPIRFDGIVAFAEVERFLDTPIKRYSSGMYVRLAFAVAAHLETNILLVDEVLAVETRSSGAPLSCKMSDVTGHGVLFVSHAGRKAAPSLKLPTSLTETASGCRPKRRL